MINTNVFLNTIPLILSRIYGTLLAYYVLNCRKTEIT